MKTIDVRVPALGDHEEVPVIEVMVNPGDEVTAEEGLVTLESDKATVDVPAPTGGRVRELRVKVGDRVKEGSVVLILEEAELATQVADRGGVDAKAPAPRSAASSPGPRTSPDQALAGGLTEVKVPDLGDIRDVPVIEVLVKPGDVVNLEDPLVTLESDKATMDLPAPTGGKVVELRVKAGDRVSEGTVVLLLEAGEAIGRGQATAVATEAAERRTAPRAQAPEAPGPSVRARLEAPAARGPLPREEHRPDRVHASPSVRKLARDLGVDLRRVQGSGPRSRILQDDVRAFVKQEMSRPGLAAHGLDFPAWPKVDFAKWGPVESKPLSRIQRISGRALARNWVMIPHVTQHDEADVTDLDAFRARLNEENASAGVKVTLLAFLVKACVAALKMFPEFNSSLDGENLVLRRFFNIGFAVDTPDGLVVPVLKGVDAKGVFDIARDLGELSSKAREGRLASADMQGGCFSISNLGGIGGTSFTPIINAPEVAILGVSRVATRPVWNGSGFAPRLILPLSLSYDHRVIDGASAARFTAHLVRLLGDLRRAVL